MKKLWRQEINIKVVSMMMKKAIPGILLYLRLNNLICLPPPEYNQSYGKSVLLLHRFINMLTFKIQCLLLVVYLPIRSFGGLPPSSQINYTWIYLLLLINAKP